MRGYYFPETAASNKMCQELVESLARKGIAVEILAPVPTRGVSDEIREKYKKKKKEEFLDGAITIKRYWLPKEKKSILQRALRYFMQNLYQIIYGLKNKYDVLFLYSTPPTNGVVGGIISLLRKKPFIYNLHDVFPDSLIESGIATEKSVAYKIGKRLENFSYRHSSKIIVLSKGIKHNLENKKVPNEKMSIVYNWVDEKSVVSIDRSNNSMVSEFNIDPDKFIVTYAGNIGVAQGVETIISAAKLLAENDHIQFVIVGNGAREEECKKLARKLKNVIFLPMQNINRLSEVYSLGDISIVTCKKGFGKCGMPSKTVNIMSAKTTLLATFDQDSDLANILSVNECGICIEPESPKALANQILELSNDREKCERLANNGRQFVEKELNKEKCISEIIDIIENEYSYYTKKK